MQTLGQGLVREGKLGGQGSSGGGARVSERLTPDVTRIPLQPDSTLSASLSVSPLSVSYSLRACLLSLAAACNGDSESFGAL